MFCVYGEILKYILQIISQDIFWEVGGGESFDSRHRVSSEDEGLVF